MLKVGFMACFNEADYIKYSIESVINHLDKLIIIEGSWAEYYLVNGKKYSDDGTISIIKELQSTYKDKIELYHHNEDSQLKQRNLYWNYCPKEDHIMILVDADEVWTDNEIKKAFNELQKWPRNSTLPLHVYTVESLIFINDFYTVSKVRYPRIWEIEHGCKYKFVEPNKVTSNDLDFDTIDLDCHYFHYSYTHSPKRFKEKKKERTKLHGDFAWNIVGETIRRPEATIKPYTGDQPKGIRNHPLYGVKKHKEVAKPEIIVYAEHSGIGNLILSTPMLKAIRKYKPNAHIYVVSWKRAARIIEGADYIDHVYSVDEAFKWNQRIDHLLISPVGAIDGVVQYLSNLSKSVYRLPPMQPWTQHESERKMLLARKLGYRGPVPKPEIKIFGYNYDRARKILEQSKKD